MNFFKPKQSIPLPTYNAEERWDEFFRTALSSLIDYEMRDSALAGAVRKASTVADAALEEYENRWKNKS